MLNNKTDTKEDTKNFYKIAFVLVFSTVLLAYYLANLLFYGKNSYEVYNALKHKKTNLEKNIRIMQLQNAQLQKQYFELKNLEPEEL